jgi:hypothetical protein
MGNDNHVVVSYRLWGFQGYVGGRVVMMKEPVVVVPKFQSFSSHIFSQASHNVTVEVRVNHSVRRNKFMVNNPRHVKKIKTISVLFVELWTCCSLFTLGDCGFFHYDDCCFVCGSWLNLIFIAHYDPRDKSWVLVSLLSQLKTHVYAPLLLIISQMLGNRLHSNAVHVQIFC